MVAIRTRSNSLPNPHASPFGIGRHRSPSGRGRFGEPAHHHQSKSRRCSGGFFLAGRRVIAEVWAEGTALAECRVSTHAAAQRAKCRRVLRCTGVSAGINCAEGGHHQATAEEHSEGGHVVSGEPGNSIPASIAGYPLDRAIRARLIAVGLIASRGALYRVKNYPTGAFVLAPGRARGLIVSDTRSLRSREVFLYWCASIRPSTSTRKRSVSRI